MKSNIYTAILLGNFYSSMHLSTMVCNCRLFCIFVLVILFQTVLISAIRLLLSVCFGLCSTFLSDGIIFWCLNTFMYLFKALLCIFICKTTHMSSDIHALLFNVEHRNKEIVLFFLLQISGYMQTESLFSSV